MKFIRKNLLCDTYMMMINPSIGHNRNRCHENSTCNLQIGKQLISNQLHMRRIIWKCSVLIDWIFQELVNRIAIGQSPQLTFTPRYNRILRKTKSKRMARSELDARSLYHLACDRVEWTFRRSCAGVSPAPFH